jgi:hypothetical protein
LKRTASAVVSALSVVAVVPAEEVNVVANSAVAVVVVVVAVNLLPLTLTMLLHSPLSVPKRIE